ncbi:hypothetical protein GCM10009863_56270 [Streptomyces axinellae]|uniref:Uncharacterized protein n=1 Tax=Streptomyces axinellae TaxID=552788 RepID=A0ABP6D0Y2_9ACTN
MLSYAPVLLTIFKDSPAAFALAVFGELPALAWVATYAAAGTATAAAAALRSMVLRLIGLTWHYLL